MWRRPRPGLESRKGWNAAPGFRRVGSTASSSTSVAERRRPEGTHRGVRVVGDGEAEHRETGGVGRDTHLRGDAGDGPGQGDVEIGQMAEWEGEGPDGDSVGTEIDVGVMPHLLRRLGDALDETGGLGEGPGGEVGVGPAEEDPPVLEDRKSTRLNSSHVR